MSKAENIGHMYPALIVEGRQVAVGSFNRTANIGSTEEGVFTIIVVLSADV